MRELTKQAQRFYEKAAGLAVFQVADKTIAEIMGVTPSVISQIYTRAEYAATVMIAARFNNGKVSLLKFDRIAEKYDAYQIDIGCE